MRASTYAAVAILTAGCAAAVRPSEPTRLSALRVSYDISPQAESVGTRDTIRVHIWLENTGSKPIEISHGRMMMFIEAFRRDEFSSRDASTELAGFTTWGRVTYHVFPNPSAPQTTAIYTHVIQPSERYRTTEFSFTLPESGFYRLRFCAEIGDAQICKRGEAGFSVMSP